MCVNMYVCVCEALLIRCGSLVQINGFLAGMQCSFEEIQGSFEEIQGSFEEI